jgi:molecular chaperone GrpE
MTDEKKKRTHKQDASAPAGETSPESEAEMVTIPAADLAARQAELEQSQALASEYLDGLKRERADFINYKRRVEREQETLKQTLTGQVLRKYLAVMDDLERALSRKPADGEGAAWAQGIELVYRKLQNILECEGVQRIAAETELFDPARHEALMSEDNPAYESGQIIEIFEQGYTLGDRILRPARVRVAR